MTSSLTFSLHPCMTKDEIQTEMYESITNLHLDTASKAWEVSAWKLCCLQAILEAVLEAVLEAIFLCIAVVFENACATARAAAPASKIPYTEPTRDKYKVILCFDRR
jgi:hypothetical protein